MSVKYRFEILYQNKSMKQVSEFMRKCDLDLGDICINETYEMTTSKERDIQEIKGLLYQAFEAAECEILKIEGGKVE